MAYVILPGNVTVSEHDQDFVRLMIHVHTENMDNNIVKRLAIIGRYSVETKIDKYGKMLALKMPNVENYIIINGIDLIESYDFELKVPKGYKIVVKDDLNPNRNEVENASLRSTM